jgi:hypothetical protein
MNERDPGASNAPPAAGGVSLNAVAQFGESLFGIVSDMAKGLFTPQVLNPSVALSLTGNPVERTAETLRLMLSGGTFVPSAEELRNKGEIFTLVAAVSGLIGVPLQGPLPLPQLVAHAYALGPFYALWAVEGLGHDYGDSFWKQGVTPHNILSPEVTRGLLPGSLLMLHAGVGLSIAQHVLGALRWNTPAREVSRMVAEIVRLDRDNSLPGYVGAAYESLGLVSRSMHPTMVTAIDRAVREVAPEVRGYFWHGVGRALYFWLFNFLPCSDWQIFQMARREAPDEPARLNTFAGCAWAYVLVNQRQPRILADLIIKPHGRALAQDGAFANGVASSNVMRWDTTPGAPFIASFCDYRPCCERDTAAMWDELVRAPCRQAVDIYYPWLKEHDQLGEVFQYHDLADFTGARSAAGRGER